MKKSVLALGAAALCSGAVVAATHTPVAITGCVRPGIAADTYVLLDVDEVTDGRPAPAGAVYKLSSTKELRPHVGHKVEVRGTYSFEGDVARTPTVKARRAETREQPRAVGTTGVRPIEATPIYRRLRVNGVRMIGASCDVP
jgi:hypothetical protein